MNIHQPWQLLLVALAGWINRQQQDVIEYLQEENRVLKSKLTGKRIRSRMVPELGPTRIGGTIAGSFKLELEPQLDLRPENLRDDGGQPRPNRSPSIELA